jgi:multiple sugar transport system substrate-binding protein
MNERKLSRRRFLGIALGAAASGALAACQPEVVERTVEVSVKETVEVPVEVEKEVEVLVTEVPPETVELRLAEGSWVGPEGIAFWTEDIIPRFELENPTIKVIFENAESPDYQDKLYTQAVAGDMPDVFFIWWSGGLMEKGQLLALDDYIDEEYLADFYPGNVVAQVHEGHLYGVPKYVSSVVMAYNKDILDAAGVDYPDDTWDWDDYEAAYRATTDPATDQWGVMVSHEYLPHYVWMNGGEWMNADLFGTECLLDGDKALEALDYLYNLMWGSDPVSPKPGQTGEFGWWNVFSTGRLAFMESHSWTVTNYIRENDFAWDFTDLPISRDGGRAGLTFCNGYSVGHSTEHIDESVTLLKFMTSPWVNKQACNGIIGSQPARRSIADEWDNNSMGARAGYDVAAFTRSMETARLAPEFKDADKINEIFQPIWEQIWVTGEIGLEEGIGLIVERINGYYAG